MLFNRTYSHNQRKVPKLIYSVAFDLQVTGKMISFDNPNDTKNEIPDS